MSVAAAEADAHRRTAARTRPVRGRPRASNERKGNAMANSIDGRLVSARTRKPLANLRVEARPTALRTNGEPIGSAETNSDGAFSIAIDPRMFKRLVEAGTDVAFSVMDPNQRELTVTGRVLWNARRAEQPVVLVVRDDTEDPEPGAGDLLGVQGVLTNELGVATPGLLVEVWDHNVGGAQLIGTSVSGADGHYSLLYEPSALGQKSAADLEIRVGDSNRDRAELARSPIAFQAPSQATVDLTLRGAKPSRPAEFDRLMSSLTDLLPDRQLQDLDADAVTYLAGRSGWDARSVAMAVQASKLSAGTDIPAGHYYALLRSGLPGDATMIHRLADSQVAASLGRAIQQGIIDGDDSINETVRRHHEAATKVLREFKPDIAVSSLGDMLSLRLNDDQQAKFLDVYRATTD